MNRAIALVLLTACGEDEPETKTVFVYVDDEPTEDTETGRDDTGGGNGPAALMEYSAGGWFGYDAVTQTIVPVTIDGDVVDPYFFLEFRSEEYDGDCDSEDCCYVYVSLDGYTNESFATDAGFLFGFHVPQGVPEGFSSCIDNGFDPADPAFYGGDPFEVWSDPSLGWGITLGGDPTSTVTEWTGQDDPYAYIIGGQFLPSDTTGEGTLYFQAWAVDGAMAVIDEEPLDRASITDDLGALVSGYYYFDVMVHFDF
jgi:hypothetical protein